MSKFFRLVFSSVAHAGKLATGSAVKADRDVGLVTGAIAPIEALLISSPRSGATTRKINLAGDLFPAEAAGAIEAPTLFLTMGGVGSTYSWPHGLPDGEVGPDMHPIWMWNWSGRIGGHAVIDPVAVVSGRGITPPPARPGYLWIRTYDGSTLDEFVLVQLDEEGAVHPRHVLPDVSLSRLSPPERDDDIIAWLGSNPEQKISREELGDASSHIWEACLPGSEKTTVGELIALPNQEKARHLLLAWAETPRPTMGASDPGKPAVKRVRRTAPPPLDEFVEIHEG